MERRVEKNNFLHTEICTMKEWWCKRLHLGSERGTGSHSCAPSFHRPSRSSPTSSKTGLRCLPLKYRTGSNRTSVFNRAAVALTRTVNGAAGLGPGLKCAWKRMKVGGFYSEVPSRGASWCLHPGTLQRTHACADARLAHPHLERVG